MANWSASGTHPYRSTHKTSGNLKESCEWKQRKSQCRCSFRWKDSSCPAELRIFSRFSFVLSADRNTLSKIVITFKELSHKLLTNLRLFLALVFLGLFDNVLIFFFLLLLEIFAGERKRRGNLTMRNLVLFVRNDFFCFALCRKRSIMASCRLLSILEDTFLFTFLFFCFWRCWALLEKFP